MERNFNSFYSNKNSLWFYKNETLLKLDEQNINLYFKNNRLQDLIISSKIDVDTWDEITRNSWFHYHPINNEINFQKDKSISISLFFNPRSLFSIHCATAEEWLKTVLTKERHQFLNDENWFIEKALQEIDTPENISGELKMGYRSKWSSGKHPNKKSKLFSDVLGFFKSAFPDIQLNLDQTSFQWDLSSEIPNSVGIVEVKERFQQVVFYVNLPFNINPDKLHKLVNQINFGLPIGNFEYLENPPNLRFKTSIEYHNMELTYTMLQNLYQSNLAVVNNYYEQFIEV